jgi:hypothetical protein
MPVSSPSLSSQLNLIFQNITRRSVVGLENGLRISASLLRNESASAAPIHIGQHIQVGAIQSVPSTGFPAGEFYREIKIFVNKVDAPDAAAWEYGSGLHDPTNPHLIPIKAKNAPILVFWWTNRNKWFKGKALPIGHPGIKMKSYLRQTMLDNQENIRQLISQNIQEALNV